MQTGKDESPEETAAIDVIRRFVRNAVATSALRRELRSCRSLHRIFEADDAFRSAFGPEKVREKVEQHPLEEENACEDSGGNDSGSSSDCTQRATIETVVHNLYVRLEASMSAQQDKDARIGKLEARIVALERENQSLRWALTKRPLKGDSTGVAATPEYVL